jgi:WXG100 family type VII secretion target
MSISLGFGELDAAARTVAETIEPAQAVLTDLSDAVAAAATGFRGQAATGLGEALGAWFDAADELGPVLQGLSQALAHLATEHQTNEGRQVSTYGEIAGRLGGTP